MEPFWKDDSATKPVDTWVPTPVPAYTGPVPKEHWSTANPRINADPVFNAQLKCLLKECNYFPEHRLRQQAGQLTSPLVEKNPAGDICETALDCFRSLLAETQLTEPATLAAKLQTVVVKVDRVAKQVADSEFKQEWAAYLEACAARKQRIADAKLVESQKITIAALRHTYELNELQNKHANEIKAIKEERRLAEAEPAPVMPRKGGGDTAQSPA